MNNRSLCNKGRAKKKEEIQMAKTVQLDANGYRKFGMRDKLAYAAGDFGCNMSFALKSYLTIFWTQYMGPAAARAGLGRYQ